MSHLTKKKQVQREKNNRNRNFSGFNTGTRDMGYASNQDRKDKLFTSISWKCFE